MASSVRVVLRIARLALPLIAETERSTMERAAI
jgi:hypothetical protein